jgi:hypothetical protein
MALTLLCSILTCASFVCSELKKIAKKSFGFSAPLCNYRTIQKIDGAYSVVLDLELRELRVR